MINTQKVRAEENAVYLWNNGESARVSGMELEALRLWASEKTDGSDPSILRLKGRELITDFMRQDVLNAIENSTRPKAPKNALVAPESLLIELTADCPLFCPQCNKRRKKEQLPYSRLSELLAQAENMEVMQIIFSGGEPMIYPYITEAVAEVTGRGMSAEIITSGWGVNEGVLERLALAGLTHLQISLNGSTEEINSKSREGYGYAIDAIKAAYKLKFPFSVNWTARKDNMDDFPNLVTLAQSYKAKFIKIIRYKPPQNEDYNANRLSGSRLIKLAELIKNTKRIAVKTDAAFSSLAAYIGVAPQGCTAGRSFAAMDSAGNFRPCPDIPLKEYAKSLKDYWQDSLHLDAFRSIEETTGEPCRGCANLSQCLGCRTVIHHDGQFEDGEEGCIFKL